MEEVIRTMVATVVVERDLDAEKEKDSQEVYSLAVKFNFTSEPQLSALQSIKMVREKSSLVNHSRIIANMQVFIYATHFEVVLRYKKRKFTKTS